MKRITAIFLLLVCNFTLFAQNNTDLQISKYDFSEVLQADSPFSLGILGKEFKRLQIYYESVTKISSDTYKVKGASNAAGNVCPFEGTIKITAIEGQNSEDFEANHPVYLLTASYNFRETAGVGTGTFSGKAIFDIWIDEGEPVLENTMQAADGYRNSQYVGVWISDKTKVKKIANWGAWRIPESGDLDQGVGQFIPSEKYHAKGWSNYYRSVTNSSEEVRNNAIYQEERSWWDKTAPVLTFKQSASGSTIRVAKPNGALIQTLKFNVSDAPLYIDINQDGYKDLVQNADDGLCYIFAPSDGKFYNLPSYSIVKYKGYLTYSPANKLITMHYDRTTKITSYYMYSCRKDNNTSQYIISFEGSIRNCETEGIWKEYDRNGKLLIESEASGKLSEKWVEYLSFAMSN